MIKKIILILLLLSQFKSKSQIDEFDNDSVLPLEVVLEHAINHSPLLNMYESYCTKSKAEMDIQKYAWMKDVTLSVDTKYGQYGNLQPMDQLSLGYGAGFVFKVPLSAIIGAKGRKHAAEAEYNASKYQLESVKEELIKTVIKQYNEVLLIKSKLKIKTESTEIANINYVISTKQLQNKEISLDQYAHIFEIYYKEKEELEITKNEYKTSLSILKQITGLTKI